MLFQGEKRFLMVLPDGREVPETIMIASAAGSL